LLITVDKTKLHILHAIAQGHPLYSERLLQLLTIECI